MPVQISALSVGLKRSQWLLPSLNSTQIPEVGRGGCEQAVRLLLSSCLRSRGTISPGSHSGTMWALNAWGSEVCSVHRANTSGFLDGSHYQFVFVGRAVSELFPPPLTRSVYSAQISGTCRQAAAFYQIPPSQGTTGNIFIINVTRGKQAACGSCLHISRTCFCVRYRLLIRTCLTVAGLSKEEMIQANTAECYDRGQGACSGPSLPAEKKRYEKWSIMESFLPGGSL